MQKKREISYWYLTKKIEKYYLQWQYNWGKIVWIHKPKICTNSSSLLDFHGEIGRYSEKSNLWHFKNRKWFSLKNGNSKWYKPVYQNFWKRFFSEIFVVIDVDEYSSSKARSLSPLLFPTFWVPWKVIKKIINGKKGEYLL